MGSALNELGPLGGAWIASNNLVDQNQCLMGYWKAVVANVIILVDLRII